MFFLLSFKKKYQFSVGKTVTLSGGHNIWVKSKVFHIVMYFSIFKGNRKLSVLLAAGPFSTSDSLSYEPLGDLVQQIQQTKPDVCILVCLSFEKYVLLCCCAVILKIRSSLIYLS